MAKTLGSRMMSSGGKPALRGEQVVGPLGDGHLPFHRVGLALLVERHDHHRRAVAAHQAGLPEERFLTLLQRNAVDDALALDALESRLQHLPPAGVDHHGHLGDTGLHRRQAQEPRHRGDGVEHPLIHVHVDQLCAVVHLLPGDLERGLELPVENQLGEAARAGHVGPLADVDEVGVRADDERLEPAQSEARLHRRGPARRKPAHRLRHRADMVGRRARSSRRRCSPGRARQTPAPPPPARPASRRSRRRRWATRRSGRR